MTLFPTPYNNGLHPSPERGAAVLGLVAKSVGEIDIGGFNPARGVGRSASFNARVLDLAPGESAAKLRAVDPTCPVDRLKSELAPMREQVRNATTPAVTNAKKHHKGATYTIEVGDLLLPSGAMFVIAVVTRLT